MMAMWNKEKKKRGEERTEGKVKITSQISYFNTKAVRGERGGLSVNADALEGPGLSLGPS